MYGVECCFIGKQFFKKWGVSFFMRNHQTEIKKRELLAALKETRGIVAVACQRSNVPRRTFYNWLDTDEDFRRSAEDANEEAVDFAESKLMERIEAGAEKSIIFFLKTRGRSRGYKDSGNNQNEMLSRDMLAMFSNAYSGKSSRFDDPPDSLEATISASDIG